MIGPIEVESAIESAIVESMDDSHRVACVAGADDAVEDATIEATWSSVLDVAWVVTLEANSEPA